LANGTTSLEGFNVWKKSHQLAIDIYSITNSFPETERFNLISQIRRAGTSIPTNIVEGHDCSSTNDFLQFFTFHVDHLKKSDIYSC